MILLPRRFPLILLPPTARTKSSFPNKPKEASNEKPLPIRIMAYLSVLRVRFNTRKAVRSEVLRLFRPPEHRPPLLIPSLCRRLQTAAVVCAEETSPQWRTLAVFCPPPPLPSNTATFSIPDLATSNRKSQVRPSQHGINRLRVYNAFQVR